MSRSCEAEPVTQTIRRILLEDFRIAVSIGIHAREQTAPQDVLVSVVLELGEGWRDPEDRIEHVLDYDFLRDGIAALVRARHFNLQETLCQQIVDLCLARPSVRRVRVTTRKPDAYPDCRSVGFEIEASR
jgi:dihydroneopterin aldolase